MAANWESDILDLHGVKHEDVVMKVEDFIMTNSAHKIICGNSKVMQKLVIDCLEYYQVGYWIPGWNLGEIILA